MTTNVRVPRLPQSSQPVGVIAKSASRVFTLGDISTSGDGLPKRYGLHSVEGFGKSSMLTHAERPIFIQSRGETGLQTLIDAGQVPKTPHFPECETWSDARSQVRLLIDSDHSFKTLAIDTANGLERLLHEHICDVEFQGEWGDKGFGSYQKGYDVSLAEWRLFLNELDELRSKKRMLIFMLLHTKVKGFKNPEGSDYDRYQPDMHEKTWGMTLKWLDVVLFGNYETYIQQGKKEVDPTRKGKAVGGTARIIYTERAAAFDAKNRLGFPPELVMGNSSAEAWAVLNEAIKNSKPVEEIN